MSVSAIFGTRVAVAKHNTSPSLGVVRRVVGVIECSSRPQKKATAHHMKTRPKKTAPWDVKRRPTVYPPLPHLPPEWTLLSSETETETGGASALAQLPSDDN